MNMNHSFKDVIRNATGATEIFHIEDIQSLWSGYGKIVRFGLKGSERDRVVVKHVKLPEKSSHPRGWNTDLSHQRKIKSYQVESNWYRSMAHACDDSCRVPDCLTLESSEDEFLMVLEDLDDSGFSERKNSVSIAELQLCLHWLANFHAIFINQKPAGLWDTGTYWHLDTRPDELAALIGTELHQFAGEIDQRLKSAQYQTLVHGDAKLANFCFSDNTIEDCSAQVAAVDFQYVGGGCGIKDVIYFIGSCLSERDCERYEEMLLDEYFSTLECALKSRNSTIDTAGLEKEWRSLYHIAWTDFHRFLKGWSPGHWKINSYSERLARDVIAQLKK